MVSSVQQERHGISAAHSCSLAGFSIALKQPICSKPRSHAAALCLASRTETTDWVIMWKQVVNRDREETGKVFLSISTSVSVGFLSGTLPHTPLVFWGLCEAPSSLAEVSAKPAHRMETGRVPLSGCCALLNLAVSMKQTSVSAHPRELSTVRALSLRAEQMNSAKDPAVSGGKDERVRYQSWE